MDNGSCPLGCIRTVSNAVTHTKATLMKTNKKLGKLKKHHKSEFSIVDLLFEGFINTVSVLLVPLMMGTLENILGL